MREPSRPGALALTRVEVPTTLRNVISNWGGFFFSAIVNFFLAPFVVGHLGNSLYGISVLIMSITGYLGLLDLGVRGTLTRYVARFRARSEHEETSKFTSWALVVFGAAGLMAIGLSLALSFWASSMAVPGLSVDWVRILLLLCGLNVAASLISGVFSGFLMALQRFDYVNAIIVLSATLRALAIVLAFEAGRGLIALLLIQLVYTVAATLVSAWASFRLYPEFRIALGRFGRHYQWLILSFSAYSFVLVVFDIGVMYLNAVLVGAFQSASMVTFFWIAASLINYSRSLLSGISKTSTPLASALEAQGDLPGLRQAMLDGARYSTVVILPIALTFILRGSTFVGLWMGPGYAELSGKVLWILTLALLISAGNQVGVATMLGISKHRLLMPMFLGQALCNIALSLILERSRGLVGAAWGATLPYLAVSLFFWPWYVRRTLGIPIRNYLLSVWARPAIAAVPFALSTFVVENLWPARTLFVFFLQAIATLPLAAMGFWYLGLSRFERHRFSRTVLQPLSRLLRPPSKGRMETLP